MPVVPAASKILVTGASGFIAIHCVAALLDKGFQVVGTVRSASKGEYLVKKFAGKPFTYTIVKDLDEASAFDSSIEGISGVLHTASPIFFNIPQANPKLYIEPAVKGTVSILEAAKASNTVQRVVITGSTSALIGPHDLPYTLTEKNWNTDCLKVIEDEGSNAPDQKKYHASKVLAEQAAWAFVEKNRPTWDIATILPPLVYGPLEQDIHSVDQINASIAIMWPAVTGKFPAERLPGPALHWVDVRDVAKAHVKALTTEKAGGQRLIVSAGPYTFQDTTEIMRKLYPSLAYKYPEGRPGASEEVTDLSKTMGLSSEHADAILGMQPYRTLKACMKDLYESGKVKGVIKE